MISARDVTKSFLADGRTVPVLHGVSLEVPENEICAIMGSSGSGKSTLLYLLAGLDAPTSGTITLRGEPLCEKSLAELATMRRSEIGFVFQAYNLMPTLSVFENVALPARLAKAPVDAERIRRTLTDLGLAEQIDSHPAQLSGGEQQRVALAKVIVQDPLIVFADEPTGALDSATGRFVLDSLIAIARKPGRSVVLVTHDPAVAVGCCDRGVRPRLPVDWPARVHRRCGRGCAVDGSCRHDDPVHRRMRGGNNAAVHAKRDDPSSAHNCAVDR